MVKVLTHNVASGRIATLVTSTKLLKFSILNYMRIVMLAAVTTATLDTLAMQVLSPRNRRNHLKHALFRPIRVPAILGPVTSTLKPMLYSTLTTSLNSSICARGTNSSGFTDYLSPKRPCIIAELRCQSCTLDLYAKELNFSSIIHAVHVNVVATS